MKAAKVVRRFSAVLGLLATGRVNLTTIRLLAPHLTRQNQEELFAAASGKRKREVQELLARRFPQPDVASSVRKLPTPKVMSMSVPTEASTCVAAVPRRPPAQNNGPPTASAAPMTAAAVDGCTAIARPAPPPALIRPLATDRYQITFTASADTREKLELACDLLRHAIPSGDPAEIFARALDLLVEDLVRQKYAGTDRPRPSGGQAEDSRSIPAKVKRAVFIRDRGRCAFIGTNGQPCGERAFIEFDHVRPYGVGGPPTLDNIELRCAVHNRYEAELFYGLSKRYISDDLVREAEEPSQCVTTDTFSFRNENAAVPRATS